MQAPQRGDGKGHGGVFGASTYSVLKTKYEWQETKGGVTSAGRWGGFMKASTYCGLVVVDIAAVDCDCATVDEDTTSGLPIKGSTSVKASTPSGRWG